MDFPTSATYVAFGFSILIGMVAFVGSGHLWKLKFRRACIICGTISGIAGIFLEATDLLEQKRGLTLLVMLVPSIYLLFFLVGRWIFKRRYGTEPYLTSSSSVVGAPPLDLFTSENKDGKKRKFDKHRRIMNADFVFTFAHVLGAVFTIMFLLFLVNELNK